MAWRHIEIDLKNKLVETRHAKGLQRQNELAQDFSRLIELIKQKNYYPFDEMNNDFIQTLSECCQSFKEGGHWEPGDICNNEYFYRIETFESFIRKHKYYFHSDYENSEHLLISAPPDNSPDILFQDQCDREFQRLYDRYQIKGSWQSLENLSSQYLGRRGITWWTNDFDFEKEGSFPKRFTGSFLSQENRWVLDFAFKVGISSDWLSDNLLFLRLDSTKIDNINIKIPSIIDALLQPIFSPQQFNSSSRWGKAFNLKEEIKPYYREYVIRHATIKAIEYIPVRINVHTVNEINPKARLDDPLVESLIANI